MACFQADHGRQELMYPIERAREIDADDPVPHLRGHLNEWHATGAHAGVVDQKLNVTDGGDDLLGRSCPRSAISNIEPDMRDGRALASEGGGRLLELQLVNIGEHDLHTFGRHRSCDAEPDTTGSSSNQGNFAR